MRRIFLLPLVSICLTLTACSHRTAELKLDAGSMHLAEIPTVSNEEQATVVKAESSSVANDDTIVSSEEPVISENSVEEHDASLDEVLGEPIER